MGTTCHGSVCSQTGFYTLPRLLISTAFVVVSRVNCLGVTGVDYVYVVSARKTEVSCMARKKHTFGKCLYFYHKAYQKLVVLREFD